MHIRRAIDDDIDRLAQIAGLAYSPYIKALGRKPAPMLANFSAQISDGTVSVACVKNTIIGYVINYPDDGYMHISSIALDPDFTSNGYGKLLIKHVEQEARYGNLLGIELYTNARMTANLAIYTHLGFAKVDQRNEYGFDRVYFRKTF